MNAAPPLQDQTALVTGASRGIGKAVALALARAGAAVALVGRSNADLNAVAHEIAAARGEALVHVADLTDAHAIPGIVAALMRRWRRLDVLVNNAGIAPAEPATDSDDFAAWEAVLRVNLDGAFRLTRLVARAMLARGSGSIVNIGSVAGQSALIAPQPGYCATKVALEGLTRALAVEWAPHGVRVNTVAPGYIATEMNAARRGDPAFLGAVGQRTPMGRFGTPEEVANVVVFLASPAAAYVTGQTWLVDGGWSAL